MWDETKSRWLVEIRYPDGSRFRKRLRREREALRLWATAQTKLEDGTLGPTRPAERERGYRVRTVPRLLEGSAPVARQLHRPIAHALGSAPRTADAPREGRLPASRGLQVEARTKVARSTTDKDLAILKAFFNWCIGISSRSRIRFAA